MEHGHKECKEWAHGQRNEQAYLLGPIPKISCSQEIRCPILVCQRHCLAISSSRTWAACCLELSSRLLLLVSRLRRARSSSRLARWNSPLRSALCGGPWGGGICRLPPSPGITWGLNLQYSADPISILHLDCLEGIQIISQFAQIQSDSKKLTELGKLHNDIVNKPGMTASIYHGKIMQPWNKFSLSWCWCASEFLFHFSRQVCLRFPHPNYYRWQQPKHLKTINWSWRL